MKKRFLASRLACGAALFALATAADATVYDIPAGSLKSALDSYVRQSGKPILFRGDQASRARSPGASGDLTNEAALRAIVAGTSFRIQPDSSGAVAVVPIALEGTGTGSRSGEGFAGGAPAVSDSADIIVTAQKRSQTLLQVPQSISVVSGKLLGDRQATSLLDYAALVPGLTLQQTTAGQTRIILRGVNAGSDSPTVSVYVDDVPFGASTGQTNGAALAGDIDPFDVQRIEVLRGPQGTLYGANSLGGLIKYVFNPPRMDRVEGRVQAGVEGVDGGGVGWSGNGVVNLPLGDKVAVRASGFYRRTPGFIDSIGIDAGNVDRAASYGGRVSLLARPTDRLTIKLAALLQNIHAYSRDSYDADALSLRPITADPITGSPVSGLNRYQVFPDTNRVSYRLYSATLDWDLGGATLTSVTGVSRLRQQEYIDATSTDAGGATLGDVVTTAIYASPRPLGVTESSRIRQNKFTQELRLASPKSNVLEWLVGGYYTREPGQIYQTYVPFDRATGAAVSPAVNFGGTNYDQLVIAQLDSVYREYAAFGSATWHIGRKFDLTGGVRWSHNQQRVTQILDGALAGGRSQLDGRSSESVFTWSIAPRFQINDRVAIYTRVAKGYRPGGPNVVPPGAGPDYPFQFQADTLVSYEGGVRAETADHVFAIDASVYYLDWKNIQIIQSFQTSLGPINADGNGKGARSYGAEVSATLRPAPGLTFAGSLVYNDARLRGDTGNGGFDGDRLPYAPKWALNLSADYERPLTETVTAFAGASARLVTSRYADFDGGYEALAGRRALLDGYHTVDLRAGVRLRRATLSVYAKNVFNSQGLITAGLYGLRPAGLIDVAPVRPRTIGATIGYTY